MTNSSEIYLSLGSNQGDSLDNLFRAMVLLSQRGVRLEEVSSIYQTDPVGYVEQNDFLNMVLAGVTDLSPMELLAVCQGIERDLQRVRTVRWGPRTIDIDIILINGQKIDTPELTVPHPRMRERAFVLVPLLEIAPHKAGELQAVIPRQKIALLMARTDVKIMLEQRLLQLN